MGVNEMTLEAAYAAWAPDLVRHASVLVAPSIAADVVADTFAQLLAAEGGGWEKARQPRAYLFGAVANTARMQHRSQARRTYRATRHLALASGAMASFDEPGQDASELLDLLSPRQREIVSLTYWDDLPPAEVAEILEVSEGTVRKQLARARARLREVLS